jgi:CRISPR/Cas system-associated exonuclease Cas4 (RecB family)
MMNELIANNNFTGISEAFETAKMGELLEEASRRGGRENKFLTKKSFAPSGIGYGSGTCPRYWYMAFHGANFEYDTDARSRANMDSGTAAGERIADLFKEAGILNASEFKVIHEDPPIFGYGDLAVTWQGEQMVGEVKTTKQESFNFRRTKMKAPGYQLIQLLIYMKVLKKEKGFFVIENKNTHELLILPVKMTPENEELVDSVFEWMRTVKKNSDEDLLPKRPFTPKSLQCKSCPVQKECWEGYERKTAKREGADPNPGVVDLPPLVVPK